MFNLESLLAPVTADRPSWSNVEYGSAFHALENAAKGKPEHRMGSSVIAAVPPEWGKVEKSGAELVASTKDLRAAVLLVKARLHNGGAAGFFEGLAFMRALLERHWDAIYPPLDADNGDPAMRVNALAELADRDAVLTPFRDSEIVTARGVGRVRVRGLERSVGGVRPGKAAGANGEEAAEQKAFSIEPVLQASGREAVAKIAAAASAALDDVRAIETFVDQKVGSDRGPDLSPLTGLLQLVAKALPGATARPPERKEAMAGPATHDPAAAPAHAAAAAVGDIHSPEDVVAALDHICAYYERHQPSSPIPLLLKRSRRLVAKSFLDIIRELVPDAVSRVEWLSDRLEALPGATAHPPDRKEAVTGPAANPPPAAPGRAVAAADGDIHSPEDAVAALDGICAYYERHEPSSPIALLLKRSRRLVAKSFLDIIRDLVPDAVPHVEGLQGKQD